MFQNFLRLLSGTGLASVIPVLSAPILTRIYTPSEFGMGELFLVFSALMAIVGSLRLDAALVIPKEDDISAQIFTAIFTNNVLLFLIYCPLILLIYFLVDIHPLYLLLPLSSFLLSLFDSAVFFHIRKGRFATIGVYKAIYIGLMSSLKIALGLCGLKTAGIIWGILFAQIFATTVILRQTFRNFNLILRFDLKVWMATVFHKFSDFPKHSLPQTLFNNGKEYAINFITMVFFSTTQLGIYTLALKVLRAPLYLVGHAISDVVYENYSRNHKQSGPTLLFLSRFFGILAIPYFSAFLWAPKLFAFSFGPDWRDVGVFGQILCPWFFLSMISISFEKIGMTLRKQRELFRITLIGDSMVILLALSVAHQTQDINLTLMAASISGSVIRIIMIIFSIRLMAQQTKASPQEPQIA